MTDKIDANTRYKLNGLWCDLYHRYHGNGQYDKASAVLKFARNLPPIR